MAGYNKATDVYERSLVQVRIENGRFGNRDHLIVGRFGQNSKIEMPPGCAFRFGGDRDMSTVEAARVFIRSVMSKVEADNPGHGGWLLCGRTGAWCLMDASKVKETRKKPVSTPDLCLLLVSRSEGRWTSYHVCGRPLVDGGSCCAVHAGAEKRREAQRQQEREERAKREEAADRLDRMRADLRELWVAACEAHGIDRTRADEIKVTGSGMAVVDGEILARFLRSIAFGESAP